MQFSIFLHTCDFACFSIMSSVKQHIVLEYVARNRALSWKRYGNCCSFSIYWHRFSMFLFSYIQNFNYVHHYAQIFISGFCPLENSIFYLQFRVMLKSWYEFWFNLKIIIKWAFGLALLPSLDRLTLRL